MSQSLEEFSSGLEGSLAPNEVLCWEKALDWLLLNHLPESLRESIHIPLLERTRGTTYEEKIDSLQKSKRRSKLYEENIIKKRKTREEDKTFYKHRTKQEGSAI